jgi:hypothetical protein
METRIIDPVELVYFALMCRWEETAPPCGKWGELDGRKACNSQAERMAYVLNKLSVGMGDLVFRTLSRFSRRRDGRAQVSQQSNWMLQPVLLQEGWALEGCMSLPQKVRCLEALRRLGCSESLVACICCFVGGQPINQYSPSDEDLTAALEAINSRSPTEVSASDEDLERCAASIVLMLQPLFSRDTAGAKRYH